VRANRNRPLLAVTTAIVLALSAVGGVLADGLTGDVDADALAAPQGNGTNATQTANTCADYAYSAAVTDVGAVHKAVFPVVGDVTVVQLPSGWTATPSKTPLSISAYGVVDGGTVHICTTTATPSGQVQLNLSATGDNTILSPNFVVLNYNISAPVASCTTDWQVGQFIQPLDASYSDGTGTSVTVNQMKNGRVVPVKLTIYDACTDTFLTDPTATVRINVYKSSLPNASQTSDAVEAYADAGASSGNTNQFRWSTDGFWIYNLDSKALALTTNQIYRVDVWVGAIGTGDKVTSSKWAYLLPTK
jgi:hypothetical protein